MDKSRLCAEIEVPEKKADRNKRTKTTKIKKKKKKKTFFHSSFLRNTEFVKSVVSPKIKPPYDLDNMILATRCEAVVRESRKVVRRKKKKKKCSATVQIESSRSGKTEAAFLKFEDAFF